MNSPYELILLDRDGVINEDLPTSVRSFNDFKFIPSSLEAIALLSQKGLKIAIVTNQAVVGRGDLSLDNLQKIHNKMLEEIKSAGGHIDKIYICTDTTIEPNNRRKPASGMIFEALNDFGISCEKTLMIGDALRDFHAARNAKCSFALVRTGKGRKTEKELKDDMGLIPILFRNVDLETKAELPERMFIREDNDDLQFSKTNISKEDGYIGIYDDLKSTVLKIFP